MTNLVLKSKALLDNILSRMNDCKWITYPCLASDSYECTKFTDGPYFDPGKLVLQAADSLYRDNFYPGITPSLYRDFS